jgi:hypothetical protein
MGLSALAVLMAMGPTQAGAQGQPRRGDRFGLRGGIWPQPSVDGVLGRGLDVRVVSGEPGDPFRDTLEVEVDAEFSEPAEIRPFVELYGYMHLGGMWWAEAALGWANRQDVQVYGKTESDTLRPLLGQGQVVFIPISIGVRAVKDIGPRQKPHNIYARAALSLIFANESVSEDIHPDVSGFYGPGSKGAPGALLAVGGEFYFRPKYAVTVDASARYSKFNYAQDAEVDLSAVWVSVGLLWNSR